MPPTNLPPLEVNTLYRTQDFEGFEFSARVLHQMVTDEDTAILRLRLSNKTILEIPATDEDLHYLLRVLMEAYPDVVQQHLNARNRD